MPEYRLECVSRTGASIAPLADAVLTGVRWELNGPGYIRYTLHQFSEFIPYPKENINEVQLWIDTTLPGQNPEPEILSHWAFHHKGEENDSDVKFDCPGLMQYFDFRFILNTSLYYTSIEQMTIAANLVTAMQSGTDQSFNIGIGAYVPSGILRSREYKIAEHKNALTLLQDFNTLTNSVGVPTGFDMAIDIRTNPGARSFMMYYPGKGVYRTDVQLEYGNNITSFTVKRDGSQMANNVYMTGGSNGDIKFENHYKDTASAAIYGEWQDVKSKSGENDVSALLTLAAKETAKRNAPVTSISLVSVEVPDRLLGVISEGDWIKVVIDRGRTQINDYYRIQFIEWLPGPGNLKIGFAGS